MKVHYKWLQNLKYHESKNVLQEKCLAFPTQPDIYYSNFIHFCHLTFCLWSHATLRSKLHGPLKEARCQSLLSPSVTVRVSVHDSCNPLSRNIIKSVTKRAKDK